jgi:hypothetical protein
VNSRTLPVLLLISSAACAVELPDFKSDQAADSWLRENSASYKSMAEVLEKSGGYSIEPSSRIPGGLAYYLEGKGRIELSDTLKGAHRVSVLIFEITNLFQERKHREVTDRVRRGELNDALKFGLLRESIEYDGLRLHLKVLVDLKPSLGIIPAEMITWISSNAKTFADYQLPYAYDYLKAQEASGHTAHYLKLFEKHRAEFLEAKEKTK